MRNRCLLAFIGFLVCASFGISRADEASVLVRTEKMTMRTLSTSLKCYGVVAPEPSGTVNLSFLRPGKITGLFVTAGQRVGRGQKLAEFSTDPEAIQAYKEAKTAANNAKIELKLTEEMAAEGFATNSRLAQAKKALADAETALEAQKKTGAGRGTEVLKAPFSGTVTTVPVAQGDTLEAGAVVMQLSHSDALRVQMGVEPADREKVRSGLPVFLTTVFGTGPKINAKVDEVLDSINPQTQLIDVVVRLRGESSMGLVPGTRLRGEIKISSIRTWTARREALLKDDHGYYIYQVSAGRARKVYIKDLIEAGGYVGVAGSFNPELPVVVQGNYELSDGMAVRER